LLWGFVISVFWILFAASELVGLLQALGLITGIDDVILGATILAWGNSLGDFVADTVMSKNGKSRLAYAACYGGPCFNLLFGLGLSLTITLAGKYPNPYETQSSHLMLISSLFLAATLFVTVIIVIKFNRIPKLFGVFLGGVYVAYSTFILLIQFKVIWPND